jgi:hypothetical protein
MRGTIAVAELSEALTAAVTLAWLVFRNLPRGD